MYFLIPPWFKNKFPKEFKNLEINSRRLTTTFDGYETLRHILQLTNGKLYTKKSTFGQSLFQEVSKHRDCVDAGIPLQYCTCNIRTRDHHGVNATNASIAVVHIINDIIAHTEMCSHLTFNRTESIRSISLANKRYPNKSNYILVHVKVQPSGGVFEGLLQSQEDMSFKIEGLPKRINKYGNQADCINDTYIMPYCYCCDK